MKFPLFVVALLCAPSAAFAVECTSEVAPVINITTSVSEPRFDYTISQKKMENFTGNADIPAAAIYDLTVNAMSTGKMDVKNSIKYTTQAKERRQICLQVSQIDVNIHINPVIYIASELRDDACEYKEYLLHELKHVEEDKRLIEDYKAIIKRNMDFAFPTPRDYMVGPVPASLAKDARQKLEENVEGALDATIASMIRERVPRQRAIDSAGEYLRLATVCGEGGAGVKPSLRKP